MLHVHCIVQHWNVIPFEHNDNRDAQQELGWRRAGNAELQRMRNYREEPVRRCFLRMLHSIATRYPSCKRPARILWWILRWISSSRKHNDTTGFTARFNVRFKAGVKAGSVFKFTSKWIFSIIHIRLHSSMHKSSHSSTQSGIRSWIQSRIHRIRRRSQQLMKSRRHSLNPRPWRLVSDLWKLKLINVFLK